MFVQKFMKYEDALFFSLRTLTFDMFVHDLLSLISF